MGCCNSNIRQNRYNDIAAEERAIQVSERQLFFTSKPLSDLFNAINTLTPESLQSPVLLCKALNIDVNSPSGSFLSSLIENNLLTAELLRNLSILLSPSANETKMDWVLSDIHCVLIEKVQILMKISIETIPNHLVGLEKSAVLYAESLAPIAKQYVSFLNDLSISQVKAELEVMMINSKEIRMKMYNELRNARIVSNLDMKLQGIHHEHEVRGEKRYLVRGEDGIENGEEKRVELEREENLGKGVRNEYDFVEGKKVETGDKAEKEGSDEIVEKEVVRNEEKDEIVANEVIGDEENNERVENEVIPDKENNEKTEDYEKIPEIEEVTHTQKKDQSANPDEDPQNETKIDIEIVIADNNTPSEFTSNPLDSPDYPKSPTDSETYKGHFSSEPTEDGARSHDSPKPEDSEIAEKKQEETKIEPAPARPAPRKSSGLAAKLKATQAFIQTKRSGEVAPDLGSPEFSGFSMSKDRSRGSLKSPEQSFSESFKTRPGLGRKSIN